MLKKLFPSTLSEIIHGVLSHPYNTRIKEVKELHLVARKGQKIQIVNTQAQKTTYKRNGKICVSWWLNFSKPGGGGGAGCAAPKWADKVVCFII